MEVSQSMVLFWVVLKTLVMGQLNGSFDRKKKLRNWEHTPLTKLIKA
jgi:hypothetical protein